MYKPIQITNPEKRKTYLQYDALMRKESENNSKVIVHAKPWYHADPTTHYYRAFREFEGFKINVHQGENILDWGCSFGVSTLAIANIYPNANVIGLDIDLYRIRRALLHTLVDAKSGYVTVYSKSIGCMVHEYIDNYNNLKLPEFFVVADGFKTPFAHSAFKAIFCMNNLYYMLNIIPKEELSSSITHILKLLSEDGYLFVSGSSNVCQESFVIKRLSTKKFSCVYTNFIVNNEQSLKRINMVLDCASEIQE